MTERLFTVAGSKAEPATPISLAEAGLRERTDLQEWVLAHPEILGPDVLVVTFEFDRWRATAGDRERDRLDVLGIDSDGRIVVAELKRDRAPDTVEMQAIKYAAMASRFTEESLVEQYARFLSRAGTPVDDETARQQLLDHAGELDPDQLRRPRLVLVAGAFPPIVTSTVVWLTEMGLDITLQRVQAYRVFSDQTVVSVSQLFPVPDVEEFTVSPQRAEVKAVEERRRRGREQSTVVRLVASKSISDGTPLLLRPTTEVTPEIRTAVEEWVKEDPSRGRAIWHNDRRRPLEWEADGGRYRPTEAGRWTTYGDLAALVGTAPQPLGQHIMTCIPCPNAHRVLGADGRPRPNFEWSDSTDTRTQQDSLEGEGVTFRDGSADPTQRLGPDDLERLLV